MSRKPGVRAIILVEDRPFERFVRSVCLGFGLGNHEIRVVPYPQGRGSGEQWVREKYPAQVSAYRREANHQQIVLIVGTDADTLTVERRRQTLAVQLTSQGSSALGNHERIVIWIPKRNIETWLLSLSNSGRELDEDTDYKPQANTIDFPKVATEFVELFRQWNRQEAIPDLLPSLGAAFLETKERLPFFE